MKRFRENTKGFTLVEVIVVLVILAVLAAVMVPSLTGWISKAKDSSLITNCRACVTAAQGLASEAYGKAAPGSTITLSEQEIIKLAGLEGTGTVSGVVIEQDTAVIDELIYTELSTNKNVTYRRLLEPHFVFGEGSGGSPVPPAQDAMQGIAGVFEQMTSGTFPDRVAYDKDKIDGVNSRAPGTWANDIYKNLTPQQQAFLDARSWSIVKSNIDANGDGKTDEKGYRIYFTDINYGSGSANDVKVYKNGLDGFDPAHPTESVAGKIQYTNRGEVLNGEVKGSTSDWSKWYDPSDPELGL